MFFLKFKTSVLSNNRFGKQAIKALQNTSFLKVTVVMRFPKSTARFPPRRDGMLQPRRVVLRLPSPSPTVCTDGRTGVR